MRILADTHTHTIASGHAFSTIEENARHAAEMGLEAIAMTDHFGPLFSPDGVTPPFGPSLSMKSLPKTIHGVRILAGTEIDIVDFEGRLAFYNTSPGVFSSAKSALDLMLNSRELTVASLHYFEGCRTGSPLQSTKMYCQVAQNPRVDIIGHIGRMDLSLDFNEILRTAKAAGTMIEINNHCFDFESAVAERYITIAQRCAQLDIPVVVSSDAHSAFSIGDFSKALGLLSQIDFPERLIANTSLDKLMKHLKPRPFK